MSTRRMALLFWFRKNVRTISRPGTIYCRITVEGGEHNFATPVRVFKDEWDAKTQKVRGRSEAAKTANDQLDELGDGLRRAETDLKKEGVYLTPERILLRYQKPQARQLSLRQLVSKYEAALVKQVQTDQITASTREAYLVRLARLDEWLQDKKATDMRPVEMNVRKAQQFFDWLLASGRSRNYAVKVLDAVSGLLRWGVRNDHLEANPMADFSEKKEKDKMPIFLTPPDLVKLWYYEFASQSLRQVADLFLFQCFTGLAWQDLSNFRASEHLIPQPSGAILLRIARQKTTTTALIPFLRPALELLARYGGERLPVPSREYMNRSLKQIAFVLGYKENLTTHVGRKTAGMVLLQDGVPMTIVSRVLGHKSVNITERCYVQVLPDTIINELVKAYGAQVVGTTQTNKPFLLEFTERLLAA